MKVPVYRVGKDRIEGFVGYAYTVGDAGRATKVSDFEFDDDVKFDPDAENYILDWSWAAPGFGSIQTELLILYPKDTNAMQEVLKDWKEQYYASKVELFDHMVRNKKKELEESESYRDYYVAKLAEVILGGRNE